MRKPCHGFATTVFGHEGEAELRAGKASPISENGNKGRLFLVSNHFTDVSPEDNQTSQLAARRTKRNRKRIAYDEHVIRNGNHYRVNVKKSGLYVEIIEKLIDQFETACQKWPRVFVLRFDLHCHFYSPDNRRQTTFRDRLFKRLQREYGFKQIGYCWVRERERAKAQHYHWVLFLDGNLIRHSSRINKLIKNAWEDVTGAYHVPVIKHPFYFGEASQIAEDVIYRVSYLAKARGKGYRADQAKDYQCSRMKPQLPVK